MKSMSPSTLMPVDEYLRTSFKPACEYRDGVLTQKPTPTWKHAALQLQIGSYILSNFSDFRPGTELTVRLSENRFLVPDIAVQRKDKIQDPYPTEPVHLCVEILSPDERMSKMIAEGEEYLAWGVLMVWIIDPINQVAWEFSLNRPLHEVTTEGALTAPGIHIPMAEIFAGL